VGQGGCWSSNTVAAKEWLNGGQVAIYRLLRKLVARTPNYIIVKDKNSG
jgi:hypothetical protein